MTDEMTYLREYGVDEKGLAAFALYRELLLQWNSKTNLTSITEKREIEINHFIDSLLLEEYPGWAQGIAALADNTGKLSVVDVGSGAGFPGIPLRMIHEQLSLTIIEASGKRVAFLNELITALKLSDTQALHSRAEDAGQSPAHRARYDWALSRGVADTAVLLEYCLPLLKVGGYMAVYKGPGGRAEADASAKAAAILGSKLEAVWETSLPEDMGKRCILIYRKQSETPSKYPRRSGVPSRQPL